MDLEQEQMLAIVKKGEAVVREKIDGVLHHLSFVQNFNFLSLSLIC